MHACLWKEQCRFPSYLLGQDQAAAVHSCTHNAAVQADCPSPLFFPSELSLLRCMSFCGIFRVFSCVIAFFVCFRGFRVFSCRGQCRIALQLTGCFADVVSPCNLPVAFTMPMLLLQLPPALAGALTRSNNAYVPLRISQSRVNWKSLRMASMERFFWSMEAFKARISLSLAITTLSSELA